MSHTRELDIVIFGATGFTGQQTCRYFAENVPRSQTRWAIAGRSEAKLQELRAQLGAGFEDLPLLVADALEIDALRELTARTQVILTTAGPYSKHGSLLVKACIDTQTDYVDITGETPWVREMIDTHHARAQRRGVRIIHCCGVDSIPADLIALWLSREAQSRWGEGLHSMKALYQLRGGFNGGTVDSMLNVADQEQLKQLAQPYLLNPGEEQIRQGEPDQAGLRWDAYWWTWTAPFLMATVNTRVVRRSEALYRLQGDAYGEGFSYQEAAWFDEVLPLKSLAMAGGSLLANKLVQNKRVRNWLKGRLPQAGEGPSEASMASGYLSVWYHAHTPSGQSLQAQFYSPGDPSNRSTVKMLSESALMLVHNRDELPEAFPGGILTPATGLGLGLVKRLQAAGITIDCQTGPLSAK